MNMYRVIGGNGQEGWLDRLARASADKAVLPAFGGLVLEEVLRDAQRPQPASREGT